MRPRYGCSFSSRGSDRKEDPFQLAQGMLQLTRKAHTHQRMEGSFFGTGQSPGRGGNGRRGTQQPDQ